MENKKLKKNRVLWVGDAGYSTYQYLNSTIKEKYVNDILLYDEIPDEPNANVKALTDNSHHVEYSIETLTQEIKKQFKKAIFYLNKSKTFLKDFISSRQRPVPSTTQVRGSSAITGHPSFSANSLTASALKPPRS